MRTYLVWLLCFSPVFGRRHRHRDDETKDLTIDEIITRAFEEHPGFSSFSSSPAASTYYSSFEDNGAQLVEECI